MSVRKESEKLGESYSTARNRLVIDLLFHSAVSRGEKCFRCGNLLDRDTFSIDHVIPWLNSSDPKKLFFDISNIRYSHMKCNADEMIQRVKKYDTAKDRKRASHKRWRARKKVTLGA